MNEKKARHMLLITDLREMETDRTLRLPGRPSSSTEWAPGQVRGCLRTKGGWHLRNNSRDCPPACIPYRLYLYASLQASVHRQMHVHVRTHSRIHLCIHIVPCLIPVRGKWTFWTEAISRGRSEKVGDWRAEKVLLPILEASLWRRLRLGDKMRQCQVSTRVGKNRLELWPCRKWLLFKLYFLYSVSTPHALHKSNLSRS